MDDDSRRIRERMPAGDLYRADDPEHWRQKGEAALPITSGHNVWLGGGVIRCPRVTIGENPVVGACPVVTKDLPANVVAVGDPAREIKTLA